MSENLKNKILDVKPEVPPDGEPALEIAQGSESEKVKNALKQLLDGVEHNDSITVEDLMNTERALGELKVDVCGEFMTIDEIKRIPDFEHNLWIWRQMKEGDFDNVFLLTFVTPHIFKILLTHKGTLWLNRVTNISDQMIESISQHKGALRLDGLRHISDQAAEFMSKHEGMLFLNGVTSLSISAAESLSKHIGLVSLNGLITLSDEAAEMFSKDGGDLFLDSLTTLSDKAVESLAKSNRKIDCSDELRERIAAVKEKNKNA